MLNMEQRDHMGHPPGGSWMNVGGDQVHGAFSLNESVGMERLRNHVDKQISQHITGSIVVWM